MKKIKSAFIKGLFVIIPLMFIIFILQGTIGILKDLLEPFSKLLPVNSLFGIGGPDFVVFLILIAFTTLVGFIQGERNRSGIIRKVESFIPGYSIVKKFLGEDSDSVNGNTKSCLATIDDAWLFAFILEEGKSGMLTVFVPSSPTPTSGNIYFMTEQQVKRLDIPPREIFKCITQLGIGADKMLEGKVKW
ncbi:MAG TPA: hypothetical protein PK536_12000 [Ignavibacteria bacterium]|nr:hypothetical protein [Bacteroidota bacterium]HRI86157.1 hypothetical protein [Ignavibacteria bacterium]HRJ99418.1 hypothetical protein [Ignavibacteria bacterium]